MPVPEIYLSDRILYLCFQECPTAYTYQTSPSSAKTFHPTGYWLYYSGQSYSSAPLVPHLTAHGLLSLFVEAALFLLPVQPLLYLTAFLHRLIAARHRSAVHKHLPVLFWHLRFLPWPPALFQLTPVFRR